MSTMHANRRPTVVVVGAGFGGITLAHALRKAPVEVLLVDRHNYYLFQPLLYQVASAALEPEEIAQAVRGMYQRQPNFAFRMAEVAGVDRERRLVLVRDGDPIPYDFLVLAAGAATSYFGIEGVEEHSFGLKSLDEAIRLRSHVMRQFERADADPAVLDEGALNFVIVGGGPTGVELAGALEEWFRHVLARDFRRLDVSRAHVVLVEASGHLLGAFHPSLRQNALRTLRKRGVEVLLEEAVVRATADAVYLKSGRVLPTRTLVWAAGVRVNGLADRLGVEQLRGGRIRVEPDLSLPGHPEVFVIGDLSGSTDDAGDLHPQVAPLAMQGARHVARQILGRLEGRPGTRFVYRNKGIMATIGRNAAVTELPGGIRTTGFLAWAMWLVLHLMQLIGFRNRLNVFVNWVWNYFTYDRSARLIMDGEEGSRSKVQRSRLEEQNLEL